MKIKLKVLTLNCWGVPVPFLCKLRHERFIAIGDEVKNSTYDVALFQEVWHKGDYETLKQRIGSALPYSHYFYSGSIGSGLCIFSRYPILETLYQRFDPNGYPHKIQHGDWFGGKGLGLAKINVSGCSVHLYVTHIHAEYNRLNDEYLAHRIAQSFSVSQFIKFTSSTAQVSLLCGDLNLEPMDLGFRMICCNAGLKDSWTEKLSTKTSDKEGYTCDTVDNSFSKGKHPQGKRIDYILFKEGQGINVDVEECSVTMGKVPRKTFNFSDHEAVEATLSIQTQQSSSGITHGGEELQSILRESLTVLDRGLEQTRTNRRFFIVFSVTCLVLAYVISVIHVPYPLDFFITFVKLALILLMGFGIVQSLIMIRSEVHGLEASREDMKHLLQVKQ